jgi:hypothetical protein
MTMRAWGRQRLPVLAMGLVCLLSASAPAVTELIPAGASWKVWEGSAPPENWNQPEFDDSAWKSGDRSSSLKGGTSYVRLAFDGKTPPSDVVGLELSIDGMNTSVGFAAYLNGTRIGLLRLPEGFGHDTPPEDFWYPMRFTAVKRGLHHSFVRDGKNVLAVTFHAGKLFADHVKSFSVDPRLLLLTDQDNQLIAGPVVSGVYRDRALLTFETRMAGTAVLKYGKVGSPKDKTATSPAAASVHKLVVKGLDADTVYAYGLEVTRAGGKEVVKYADSRFRTAPAKDREFVFGVFADSHSVPGVSRLAAALKADKSLEFILGLGDLVNNGGVEEIWRDNFFGPWRDLLASRPFWPTIGNHDWGGTGQARYFRTMFPCVGDQEFYAFVYGPARFVGINPSAEYGVGPSRAQFESFVKVLTEAKERYLFVFEHQPLFPAPYVPRGSKKDSEYGRVLRPEAKALMPLMEKCKVTAFLAGHNHAYKHVKVNDFNHVICGGGGAYLRVRVSSEKAVVEAIHLSGKVIDTFELKPRK